MKKEYMKPVVETIGMDLSELIVTSPGEGYIGPDSPGFDDGGATKEKGIYEW